MYMAARRFNTTYGEPRFIPLPNWTCPDQVKYSDCHIRKDLLDRGDAKSCGDGPVFIGHKSTTSFPKSPDGAYRMYSGAATGGYWEGGKFKDLQSPFECIFSEGYTHVFPNWCATYSDDQYTYDILLQGNPDVDNHSDIYSIDVLYGWGVRISRFARNTALSLTPTSGMSVGGDAISGTSPYADLWREALSTSLDAAYDRIVYLITTNQLSFYRSVRSYVGLVGVQAPGGTQEATLDEFAFHYNQYSYWCGRVSDLPGSCGLFDQSGFVHAYYNAVDKLPQAGQNSLGNILEIISAIRSFKKGFKPYRSLKEAAQSAWLAYRYSYSTTISDLEEASALLQRLGYLVDTNASVVRSYGRSVRNGQTYNACIVVDFRSFLPSSLSEKMRKIGNFRLSAENVWDMIPFSFMVDWILGVSDILHDIDLWLESAQLPILEVWYSYSSLVADNSSSESIYFRWRGHSPALPRISHHSSGSAITIVKRVADVLSIFF